MLTNSPDLDVIKDLIPENLWDISVNTLSFGQCRLLNAACSILVGRQVLLLDEPFAGIDRTNAERLTTVLSRIRSERLIITVDHRIDQFFDAADQVYALRDGRIVLFAGSGSDRTLDEVIEVASHAK